MLDENAILHIFCPRLPIHRTGAKKTAIEHHATKTKNAKDTPKRTPRLDESTKLAKNTPERSTRTQFDPKME